jgi:hypothetical protein
MEFRVSYSEPADATHFVVQLSRQVWDVRNIPSDGMLIIQAEQPSEISE